MKKPELKAVPEKPQTLPEKIAEMKKQLDNFIANANREVARLSGKIEFAEEMLRAQKEATPDAD
jgi:hypothetical protein